MFSNKLIALFILPALLFLYLAWKVDERYAPWLIPFLLAATVVYIFKNEIDWWWHTKRPPVMAAPLQAFLERFHPFYQALDTAERTTFRTRVEMFKMGTDWMPVGWPEDELPDDIKTAIAAAAVTVTFREEVFLFNQFEKVIVYPRPFPTEQYPHAHASELYAPDGCLLFSAEQVMWAFTQPQRWYNVAVHEYAKAFVLARPEAPWPTATGENLWEKLSQMSGMDQKRIEAVLGMPIQELLPVLIHHYFLFPGTFSTQLVQEKRQLDRIFGSLATK
jgi:hypothetical protein